MFKIRCRNCGASQEDSVYKKTHQESGDAPKRNETISDNLLTEFRCVSCETVEHIDQGVLPELNAEHFESIWVDDDISSTTVLIDGEKIRFESVDEQIAENSHYTPEGIQGTTRVHHVHIHAVNPPTLSKGDHRVKIGDFIDNRFTLATIRYHDNTHRTLKFYRSIPNQFPESINTESPSRFKSEIHR